MLNIVFFSAVAVLVILGVISLVHTLLWEVIQMNDNFDELWFVTSPTVTTSLKKAPKEKVKIFEYKDSYRELDDLSLVYFAK